ncbi:MAG TPA: hypothetical protein V6D08_20740 [Candidatus Obscuribacterales bacterium]
MCKQRSRPRAVPLVILLLGLALLPGVLQTLSFSEREIPFLCNAENHYSVVVAPGDRLAAGFKLFTDITPRYGVLFPLIAAAWEKARGPLTMGEYVRIVCCLQVLFVCMAAFLYARYARGFLLPAGFAIIFLLPSFSTTGSQIYYPNLTGWRFLGFGMAALALLVFPQLSRRTGLFLVGAAAGLSLLMNFETGLVIAVGYLMFLYIVERERFAACRKDAATTAALLMGGFAVSLALWVLLVYLVLGYWPDLLGGFSRLLERLVTKVESSSASGFKLFFDPLALLAFFHAAYCLVSTCWSSSFAALGPRGAFRGAISTMILLWFSYYAMCPASHNLVAICFLYGFLLVDMLRSIAVPARKQAIGFEQRLATVFLLSLVVIPFVTQLYAKQWPAYVKAVRSVMAGHAEFPARLVSGVYVPVGAAEKITEKACLLESLGKRGPVCYLTSHSLLMPKLSGVFSAGGINAARFQLKTEEARHDLIKALAVSNCQYVLFDYPDESARWGRRYAASAVELRLELAPLFGRAFTAHGWEVWRRRKEGLSESEHGEARPTLLAVP